MRHQLHREQFIPAAPAAVWEFFATPRNLNELTPPQLKFRIVGEAAEAMHSGQLIEYRISLFPGLWMRWLTEIRDVETGVFFADEQRKGPYKFWRHEHRFVPANGGVLMTDHITYDVGWGLVGRLVERIWVRRQLAQIFDYRFARVARRFGGA